MSRENVEIVREIYADQRGLIATAFERAAPDVEFDFTDLYPDRPVLKGIEECIGSARRDRGAVRRSIWSRSDSSTWTTNGS
jgi:hypothetical protein